VKLVVMEFVSLDGVSQGPGSPDEDTSEGFTQGGWLVPHIDEAFIAQTAAWLRRADALLLGRRTYDAFARDWPQITDPDDPFTELMNSLPKYVASQTLKAAEWNPTTILSGDVAAQVEALKRQPGRELQVHGSARLARSLLEAGLVDQLRLVVAPVVVGRGRRLFPDGGAPAGLRLASCEATPAGLVIHEYEWAGQPEHATYAGASDFTSTG
jgi:dihydrofolate reductase